jgi:hypothetical protein
MVDEALLGLVTVSVRFLALFYHQTVGYHIPLQYITS